MNDHLPECVTESVQIPCPDGKAGCAVYHTEQRRMRCICDQLRACEQRREWELGAKYLIIIDEQQAIGYAKGLQAVRKAIVALPHFGDFVDTVDVFAAIDALEDDQK